MVGVTLRFDYPWNDEKMDENEIRDCLTELPPEELLRAALKNGEAIDTEIEVY